MKFSRKSAFVAGVLASAAMPSAAFAETAVEAAEEASETSAAATGDEDDRITIVTGTKQNQSLQKEEVSLAVITRSAIEEQALFDLRDVFLRTANVSSFGDDAINRMSIRGIPRRGVTNVSPGATIDVYVDGAPASFAANQGVSGLWDIEQVEILRGPQSTVRGRNTLAGAVIINSADPEYDFNGRVRGIIGTRNTYQVSGMVTGPIVDGQVAFRLAGDYQERNFEVLDVPGDKDAQFIEAVTLRGKLLIEPEFAEGLRVELIGSYADTHFGQFNIIQSPVPVTDPAFADFDIFGQETFPYSSRLNFDQVLRGIADIDYEFSDVWSLKVVGTVEDVNRHTDFAPADFSSSRHRVYSGELRANFDYGEVSGWFGAYLFDDNFKADSQFEFLLSRFGTSVSNPEGRMSVLRLRGESNKNQAIFGGVTWELGDKWSVNIAARYDWESLNTLGVSSIVTVDPPSCVLIGYYAGDIPRCDILNPFLDSPPLAASYAAFLPRGSLSYQLSDDVSLTAIVARGYRAGGAFPFSLPLGTPESLEYDPAFLTNYELALRSQFWDQRVTLNANVFYSNWDDQQIRVSSDSFIVFTSRTLNVGKSELYGAEVDLQVKVTPELDVFSSLGLLSTEFINFPYAQDLNGNLSNPAFSDFANLSGRRFPGAPKMNLSMGFSYEDDNGFFVSGNGAYSSKQFARAVNLPENESDNIVLVNARIGYRTDIFEVAVFANNLFNERAITHKYAAFFRTRSFGPIPDGVIFTSRPEFTSTDPSVIGVQIGMTF